MEAFLIASATYCAAFKLLSWESCTAACQGPQHQRVVEQGTAGTRSTIPPRALECATPWLFYRPCRGQQAAAIAPQHAACSTQRQMRTYSWRDSRLSDSALTTSRSFTTSEGALQGPGETPPHAGHDDVQPTHDTTMQVGLDMGLCTHSVGCDSDALLLAACCTRLTSTNNRSSRSGYRLPASKHAGRQAGKQASTRSRRQLYLCAASLDSSTASQPQTLSAANATISTALQHAHVSGRESTATRTFPGASPRSPFRCVGKSLRRSPASDCLCVQ
jgi:hypothetical protein